MEKKKEMQSLVQKLRASAPLREIFFGFAFYTAIGALIAG